MVTETMRANLKAIVAAYRRATGAPLSRVSKEFYGNGDFFKKFFGGAASISLDRLDRMLEEFAERWPEGVEWPYLRPVLIPSPNYLGKAVPK